MNLREHQAKLRAVADQASSRSREEGAAGHIRRVQIEGDRYHVVVPAGAERIDRNTVLGNPFPVATYGLNAALSGYQRYLGGDQQAVDEARRIGWRSWRRHGRKLVEMAAQRIGDKAVACWCGPDSRCHGDLLLAAVDVLRRENQLHHRL